MSVSKPHEMTFGLTPAGRLRQQFGEAFQHPGGTFRLGHCVNVLAARIPSKHQRGVPTCPTHHRTVEAHRCADPDGRDLVSREGVVHTQEGDWILTDGPGNSWPVSGRWFHATYALIES